MKWSTILFSLICVSAFGQVPDVYSIKADSVRIYGCDSAELILENHTQNILGFLFNKGNGRTEFRRAMVRLDDSTYVVGADTLKILQYLFSSGLTNNARVITANLSTGVTGGQSVRGGTGSGDTLRISSTTHATKGLIKFGTSFYDEVNNSLRINTNNVDVSAPSKSGLYLLNSAQGQSGNLNQWSPMLTWEGQAYATTPAVSQPVQFRSYLLTAQGTAAPSGTLSFVGSVDNTPPGLGFYITTPDTTGASRVGIGTANPVSGFEFSGFHPVFTISNTSSGSGQINFTNSLHTVSSSIQSIELTPTTSETRLVTPLGNTTFFTNAQERLIVDSFGNVGINTHTPRTTSETKGWILTSNGGLSVGATAFSGSTPLNGLPNISTAGNLAVYTAGSGGGFGHDFKTNGFSRLRLVDTAAVFGAGNIYQNTSGTVTPMSVVASFSPGSGTATFAALSMTGTISQGVSATGITRGLYVNPTLTNAVDYRAIEVKTGKSILNGKVSVNSSASPTAGLLLGAGSAAAGSAPLKLTSGTLLTTPEDGAIEYDGTDYFITQSTTRYKLSKALTGQLTTSFSGATVTPGNMATATLTVTGVDVGDVVTVNANSGAINPASILITAYCINADTVTIRAYNAGSSNVTLASDTYNIRVIK